MPSLVKYALRYAALGLPVFPCIPGDKRPLTPHGFKDASTDPDVIAAWWQRWPDANVAAPTGVLFDVVDVDSLDALAALEVALGMPDELFDDHLGIANTPHGWHFLRPVSGRGNGANVIVPGVDYRGDGGYVVLPPSRTDAGTYTWAELPTFRAGEA